MAKLLLIFVSIFYVSLSFADNLNSVDQEALDKTIKLLNSESDRGKVINEHPDAQKADDMVEQLVKQGAMSDDIYALSANIFKDLVREAQGDSAVLQKLLMEAQKNPESLYRKLSTHNKNQLKEITESIEKKKQSVPAK